MAESVRVVRELIQERDEARAKVKELQAQLFAAQQSILTEGLARNEAEQKLRTALESKRHESELVAQLRAQLAGKWQKIETAPRDGTRIIGYQLDFCLVGEAYFDTHAGWWVSDEQRVELTYWQPLPPAPESKED